MQDISTYNNNPIALSMLREDFARYSSPNDKISRLEQEGSLIRLKRGLYVVSPELTNHTLSRELIANHILGPSYLSYESALSYYGLIPERVEVVRSATSKRSKRYTNNVGEFEYITIPKDYFPIGIRIEIVEESYAFIIATPEKAICDLIMATAGLRLQSAKAVREYLTENLRIDEDEILQFDASIIEECIQFGYKKNDLTHFHKLVKL